MAVVDMFEDKGSVLRKRKRKKICESKKIDVNEKIEVRSVEEGFLGSWHQGTLIAWDKRGCHVKYDYLLVDDGSDNLVEIVSVPSVKDGLMCPCENHCNYRGSIRRLPPKVEFNKWNLFYGLCVDVWYMDAWWEGVIFDHEDGLEKRRVFFPDLGDEMIAEVGNLRVTQDWDEFEEEWHQRGTWLFLELTEEYEQEWFISVSVKQLWYDLREKMGFQNFREWMFSCDSLWRELVLEVIKDNHEITVNHFLKVLGLPGSSQLALAMPDADVNMSSDADLPDTNALVPVENPINGTLLSPKLANVQSNQEKSDIVVTVSKDVTNVMTEADVDLADTSALVPVENPANTSLLIPNSASTQLIQGKSDMGQLMHNSEDDNNNLTECNGSCLDKAVSVLPSVDEALLVSPPPADGISCISSVTSHKGISRSNTSMAKRRVRHSRCDETATWMPASPVLVPKAEPCPDAIAKYALLGKKDGKALVADVRKHLVYHGWKIEFKRDKYLTRVRYISPTEVCYYSLYKLCLELTNHSGKLVCSNAKDMQVEPNKDQHVVEPEYCPQAVFDWSKYEFDDRKSDMILKAKKHLSWLGWQFQYASYKTRRMLCYISPRGRIYKSLRAACRGCINECKISQNDASPSRPMEKVNVIEEVHRRSYINEGKTSQDDASPSRPVEKVNVIEEVHSQLINSVPSNAKSENAFRLLYSKLEARNSAVQSRVCQRMRKPKRKRNDSLSCPLSDLVKGRAGWLVKNTSISRLKGGKSPAALIKLRENLKGRVQNRVLRSTKRVQQVDTPSTVHQNPRTVLSWLIDNNVVLPRSKVHHWGKRLKLKVEGRITRNGIKCNCCDKLYTLGGFVAHAGSSNHRAAAKIFLKDGRSLLDCQQQMMQYNKMKKIERKQNSRLMRNCRVDKNDNICSVCHYGGELILCDQCPSSFHKSCLGLESVPDGNWFCPSCCCGICGQSRLIEDGTNIVDDRVLTCAQCEHIYHAGCIYSRGPDRFEICAKENWFCSKNCEEIFLALNKVLGRPILVGTDNLTWTLTKFKQSNTRDLDASDKEAMVENYSKLSIALEVMHECFEPVKEPFTGGDLVADIIFSRSSKLKRINFRGFYTILLERDDELITVANVRVHGEKVAEIPLIGTRFQYRRLGMCRILMNELEKRLKELGVQRLILPAVHDVLHTWTGSFGFSKMMPSERFQFVDYTFLDFQGAIMCQKLLFDRPSIELNLSIGSPLELPSDASEYSDTVNVDGSSSVSEVFQTRQNEDHAFMNKGLLESDAGGGINSNINHVHNVVNQQNAIDNNKRGNEVNPNCSVEIEDISLKKRKCRGSDFIRCYKRRRISVSGR